MSWSHVVGHREVIERLCRAAQRDRLAGAYLFVGPAGVGKHTTACEFAKALLCEGSAARAHPPTVEACDECPACRLVDARTHPDLMLVAKRPDKNELILDQFLGKEDKRGREGLCHDIALKPFRATRKVAIIDDADLFNEEGANALLKTLEEPPPRSVIILVGTMEQRQLPTIRSRVQTIRFGQLATEEVREVLRRVSLDVEPAALDRAIEAAQGSVSLAMALTDPHVASFRQQLLDQLASLDPTDGGFPEAMNSFVERDKAENPVKRARLRFAADLAIEFYRALTVSLAGQSAGDDETLSRAVAAAARRWRADIDTAARCVERSMAVHAHVAANAQPGLVIDGWLDDLDQLSEGRDVPSFLDP